MPAATAENIVGKRALRHAGACRKIGQVRYFAAAALRADDSGGQLPDASTLFLFFFHSWKPLFAVFVCIVHHSAAYGKETQGCVPENKAMLLIRASCRSRRRKFRLSHVPCPCLFLLACLLFAPAFAAAQKETTVRQIGVGITYTQEITRGSSPQRINILRVNLNAPGVKIRTGLALDSISLAGPTLGRETLQNTALRNKALAAVNADFFPFTGDPVGLAIRDGELVSEPLAYRACLGISDMAVRFGVFAPCGNLMRGDGAAQMKIDGINRVPHSGDTIVLTPRYAATPELDADGCVVTLKNVNLPVRLGQTVRGTVDSITRLKKGERLPRCRAGCVLIAGAGKPGVLLPERFKTGDAAQFRFDLISSGDLPQIRRYPSRAGDFLTPPAKPLWTDVQTAVGGGPWLVRNGKVVIDGAAEGFSKNDFIAKKHPRTAVGMTRDRQLIFLTVDGRQDTSEGMTLPELAERMRKWGAEEAINLDGGGSTSMFVAGGIVNGPSDGSLRPIADSLLIYGEVSNKTSAEGWRIAPFGENGVTARVGETVSFRLENDSGIPAPLSLPIVWGTDSGLGFISQRGAFRSTRPGSLTVLASIGGAQWQVPVYIMSGVPAKIGAVLKAAGKSPDRNLLFITVRDKFGNPVHGSPVSVSVVGGRAEREIITDAAGESQTEIVWKALPKARRVTVRAGNAPPVMVQNGK